MIKSNLNPRYQSTVLLTHFPNPLNTLFLLDPLLWQILIPILLIKNICSHVFVY